MFCAVEKRRTGNVCALAGEVDERDEADNVENHSPITRQCLERSAREQQG